MMNASVRKGMLTTVGIVAFAAAASGCTAGVLVGDNFEPLSGMPVSGAHITFMGLDANLVPTGDSYDFSLNNQPYISFDAWQPTGATTSDYPGLVNSSQYIPPGNYYVDYFQPQTVFLRSGNFVHSYDGSCRDDYSGNTDKLCEQYFFQLADNCQSCPSCGTQPLPTHLGIKVIQICEPTAGGGF